MSPIEQHWINTVNDGMAKHGVTGVAVTVRSAEAENWRFRLAKDGREFEIGFNARERLWVRETTPGREKHLVSNDHRSIHSSADARELAVRLVATALADPAFPPRDPPVI